MKLVIIGATGYIGQETLQQALVSNDVESVVVIGRRPALVPSGVDATKLRRDIVLENFMRYPEDVKREIANADACIWTVAITPKVSKKMAFNEVKRITRELPLAGLQALIDAHSGSKHVRFLYYSGHGAERDQSKTPPWEPEYCLMRGQVETDVLDLASKTKSVQVCVLRPGQVFDAGIDKPPIRVGEIEIPNVNVDVLASAVMKQCVQGIEKETLSNDELAEIGKAYRKQSRL